MTLQSELQKQSQSETIQGNGMIEWYSDTSWEQE